MTPRASIYDWRGAEPYRHAKPSCRAREFVRDSLELKMAPLFSSQFRRVGCALSGAATPSGEVSLLWKATEDYGTTTKAQARFRPTRFAGKCRTKAGILGIKKTRLRKIYRSL